MSTFNFNKQDDTNYFIEGDMTFSSINKKTIPSFVFLKNSKAICINLKKVANADSAGLAFLLELVKQSKRYDTELAFKNIPHQLLTLATLSGLDLNEYLTEIN